MVVRIQRIHDGGTDPRCAESGKTQVRNCIWICGLSSLHLVPLTHLMLFAQFVKESKEAIQHVDEE
jgi:hypothetical protein